MCRSIKTLRRPDGLASDEEVRAAALQFVRKVSGYRAPSRLNQEAFDAAVDEVSAASGRLLSRLSELTATAQAGYGGSISGASTCRPMAAPRRRLHRPQRQPAI